MEIIEPDAVDPDGIQVWCIQDRISVQAQVPIPLIVGDDQ
jgi:hypothetical protein